MLSQPPPDRESNMTEIDLKLTPKGKRAELEHTINELMQAYEHENGLVIHSMSFQREPIMSSRQPIRKPTVSFTVQVPK